MRVAVVQTYHVFGEVHKSVENALSLMETVPADLFVLPELFSTGYNFVDRLEVKKLAEPSNGSTFRTVGEWTKKHSGYVVYDLQNKQKRYIIQPRLLILGG